MALAILSITLVQGFRSPSNMNISNILDLNDHINAKPIPKLENQSHMNYSSMEPVLFENSTILNYHDQSLELPHSSNSIQWKLHWAYCSITYMILMKILKTPYSKLVTNNYFDYKLYEVKTTYFVLFGFT